MQEGGEMGTYCVCVADSLCCKAEANTLLWGNYTSIKMLKKKKKRVSAKALSIWFVDSPLNYVLSGMHTPQVVGHGASNLHPKVDHQDKLQEQT